MKYSSSVKFFLLIVFFIQFTSCKKGQESESGSQQNLTTVVVKNVEGFLFIGNPGYGEMKASGATVECGGKTTTTDRYGYFKFTNVSVNENTAFIKASISSYRDLIKSFVPNEEGNFIVGEFTLEIPVLDVLIDAQTGGMVNTYANPQYNIEFANNCFQNNVTGGTLTGNIIINSAIRSFNNSDDASGVLGGSGALYTPLQGSLLGLNSANREVGIYCNSYLIKADFHGAGNEKVTIMPGKKIKISSEQDPICENVNIPVNLWHFDLSKNRWIQDATASVFTRSNGRRYFSAETNVIANDYLFAASEELVNYTAKIVSSFDNKPIVNALIRVNKIGEKQLCTIGYTDLNGIIKAKLPADQNVELCVLPNLGASGSYSYNNLVNDAIFTKPIGNFSSDIDLNTIVAYHALPTSKEGIRHFQGRVVDCNNNPIINGKVSIMVGFDVTNTFTNTNGDYSINFTSNNTLIPRWMAYNTSGSEHTLEIYNAYPMQQIINYTTDTMQVCHNNTSEFVNFTIDGIAVNYSNPSANFKYLLPLYGVLTFPLTESVQKTSSPSFELTYEGDYGKGVRPLRRFLYNNQFATVLNSPPVIITEDRLTGSSYVAGAVQNIQVKYADNSVHVYSCNFRVKNNL